MMMCAGLLLAGVGAAAELGSLPPKKLIMTGWDQPDAGQFRRDLAAFEAYPFDGVVLSVPGSKPDGTSFTSYNNLFSAEPWSEAMFGPALADLKAARSARVTNNFVLLWSLPHTVDWFDDAGWAVVAEKFRLMARVAKQGGLRGILFDPEHYHPERKPWRFLSQPARRHHAFAEYLAKVRQRGQQSMRAMAAEFPDLTLFGYFLLSLNGRVLQPGGSLAGLEAEDYGLWAAFVDGWLDAAPATVTFVDGQEFAYRWDGEAAFLSGAVRVKNDYQAFVTPANRPKYRAQVQASFGFYLDAYVNPPGASYYLGREGEPRVQRLEANLEAAVRAADEYVWIYGEKHRWWPPRAPDGPPTTNWTEALPGIELALLRAKNPVEAARRWLASGAATNCLRNGDFSQSADGRPAGWWVWQDEKDRQGLVLQDSGQGAARLVGVGNGCLGQNVPVQPGERYAVAARARQTGRGVASLRVGWKNAVGRWVRGDTGLRLTLAPGSAGQWGELTGAVRVPEGVAELVVQLCAQGQEAEADAAWFDDVRLARFAP